MSDTPDTSTKLTAGHFDLPRARPEVAEFLRTRRSNLAKMMTGPGPDAALLGQLLTIAARVPDHRKLAPWRFIIFEADARERIGEEIARIFAAENPNLGEERVEFERRRFLRAPLVVGVVSSPVTCPRGTPVWEQELSAGAVCFNLCLAAQAHGLAAQWLTEWMAYHAALRPVLGLESQERIAGFVYIGRTDQVPTARARPDMQTKTLHF